VAAAKRFRPGDEHFGADPLLPHAEKNLLPMLVKGRK
jgi:hypothetical protein